MTDTRDLRQQAQQLRQQLPQRQSPAPDEHGTRVAVIKRSKDEEIRISWCTYEDRPYVNVRLWKVGEDGATWYPQKEKGLTFRIRELPDLADAVAELLILAQSYHQWRAQQGGQAGPGAARPARYDPARLPAPSPPETPFSEFEGGHP
jgi:hypothetical protein